MKDLAFMPPRAQEPLPTPHLLQESRTLLEQHIQELIMCFLYYTNDMYQELNRNKNNIEKSQLLVEQYQFRKQQVEEQITRFNQLIARIDLIPATPTPPSPFFKP